MRLKQREGRPHLKLPCYPSPTPSTVPPRVPQKSKKSVLSPFHHTRDLAGSPRACSPHTESMPGERTINEKRCPTPSEK